MKHSWSKQPWGLVALAIVVSVTVSVVVVKVLEPPRTTAAGEEDDLTSISLERLQLTLAALEDRQRETAASLEELRMQPAAGSTGSRRVPVDDLDAAIARWMEENLPELVPGAAGGSASADDVATADLDDLMDLLLAGGLSDLEEQQIWQRLRDAGRLDEVIAEFERRAELDPDNPDLQVELGGAYLQKIFEVGNGPLAGKYGMLADEAFDRALALDETHWEARLTKAIALSNWPAFMGKSTEAIQHFEILIEQQKSGPSRPEHAQTYYFLGNMLLQTGDQAKALEIWREGLVLFPGNPMLLEQVDLADN